MQLFRAGRCVPLQDMPAFLGTMADDTRLAADVVALRGAVLGPTGRGTPFADEV